MSISFTLELEVFLKGRVVCLGEWGRGGLGGGGRVGFY